MARASGALIRRFGMGPAGDARTWAEADRTRIPFTDLTCRNVLVAATACLVLDRGGDRDDPGATISVLVSLLAEAQAWLIEVVADARHHNYTWDSIAEYLASTVPAARHRYAAYAAWRCHPPPGD
jgi:hypothetical protein